MTATTYDSGTDGMTGLDLDQRAAHEALLAEVIAAHRRNLSVYVGRLTRGDRGWTEDVLQETFLRAWRHMGRMTSPGSVGGWLMRVAHNLVMDGYRYRAACSRPYEVALDQAPPVPVPDHSEHVLSTILVHDALSSLSPEHRAALEQTYLRDRTAAQAAAVLGIPVGTVKSRVFHGLRLLRATQRPHGE
jgi:RNA polymerase sigma-70 factor, ECF subfamily